MCVLSFLVTIISRLLLLVLLRWILVSGALKWFVFPDASSLLLLLFFSCLLL